MELRRPVIIHQFTLEHRADVHKAPRIDYLRFLCSEAPFFSAAQPLLRYDRCCLHIDKAPLAYQSYKLVQPIVWAGGYLSRSIASINCDTAFTAFLQHTIVSEKVLQHALCAYQLPDYSVKQTLCKQQW